MKRTIDILDRAKTEPVSQDRIFQAVCVDVAEETGANRVSIWYLENNDRCVRCACYYEKENTQEPFSSGQVLFADDIPNYFDTILKEKSIVAPDARKHPATAELTDSYFCINDIYSLLDFVIHENFKPMGMICCENAGAPRDWHDEDISYLRKISSLFSFYVKSE